MADHLLDVDALAELLGVLPTSVRQRLWRARRARAAGQEATFPEPDATYGRSPVWAMSTIRAAFPDVS